MALDGGMVWPPPEWLAGEEAPVDPFAASPDASVVIDPVQLPDAQPVAHIDAAGNLVGYQEPEVAPAPQPTTRILDDGRGGQIEMLEAPASAPAPHHAKRVAPPAAPAPPPAPAAPVSEIEEPAYDGGWEQFISNENAAPPEEVPLHAQPIDQSTEGLADSPVPESVWQPQAVEQETSRLLDMPEEDYAKHVAAEQAERDAFRMAEARRIEDENRREMEHNREADRLAREETRRKLVDVNARLQELSQQDIERNRWMSSRSAPQKVALYGAAMINGFLNPGGRNGAIELVQQEIDRDIDIQVKNLASRRAGLQAEMGLVGQLYDISGDEFQAAETARLAMYGDAIKKLEMDAQQYDPLGSQAMRTRDAVMEFRARQQAAAAALEEKLYKRDFEERKFQLDVNADRRAQEKHKKSMAGGGAAKQMPPEYWQALYGVAPPVPMSDKEFKSWVNTTGDIRKLTGGDVEGKTKEVALEKAVSDLEVSRNKGVVLDDKQQPLGQAIDPEKAPETRAKIEAYGNLRNQLKDLYDLIAKKPQEQKLIGRWKSENKAAVDTQRRLVANTYAKIVDPVGAVSDKTIEAAMEVLPDVEGFTEKKHPKVVYQQVVHAADQGIEDHAKYNILGYKPGTLTQRHQANDAILLAPSVTPAERDDPSIIERNLDIGSAILGAPGGLTPEMKAKLRELEAQEN